MSLDAVRALVSALRLGSEAALLDEGPTDAVTIHGNSRSMRWMSLSATRSGAKRFGLDRSRWNSQPMCA